MFKDVSVKCALVFGVLFLVLVAAGSSDASNARLRALGNEPILVKDSSNIFDFVSTVNDYTNNVYVENASDNAGVGDGQNWGTVVWGISENNILGISLDRPSGLTFPARGEPVPMWVVHFLNLLESLPADGMPADGMPADGMPADGMPADGMPADGMPPDGITLEDLLQGVGELAPSSAPSSIVDLIYGRKFDDTDFGVGLAILFDTEDNGVNVKNSQLGIDLNVGVGLDVGEASELDINLGIGFTSVDETLPASQDYDSGINFGIDARLFRPKNKKTTGILGVRFGFDTAAKQANADDLNLITFKALIGCDHQLSEDANLILGLALELENRDRPDMGKNASETNISIPVITAAVEMGLTDWLDVRAGARRASTFEFTSNGVDTSGFDTDYNLDFGVGLSLGGLTLDGVITKKFLETGPDIISNNPEDVFSQVAVTYSF